MSTREWYVEIVPYGREFPETDPGFKRMGPMFKREAERVDSGANINLNHDRYYTRLRRANEP